MRKFFLSVLLLLTTATVMAQPGDTTKTKTPNNVKFLTRLVGKKCDSVKLRIESLGYHRSNDVTPYWEERDKIYYIGYRGNTAYGKVMEIGCDEKTSEVVYASFSAFKKTHRDEVADSLRAAGYQAKQVTKKFGSSEWIKELWELKDNLAFTMVALSKDFFKITVMTPAAAKYRKE